MLERVINTLSRRTAEQEKTTKQLKNYENTSLKGESTMANTKNERELKGVICLNDYPKFEGSKVTIVNHYGGGADGEEMTLDFTGMRGNIKKEAIRWATTKYNREASSPLQIKCRVVALKRFYTFAKARGIKHFSDFTEEIEKEYMSYLETNFGENAGIGKSREEKTKEEWKAYKYLLYCRVAPHHVKTDLHEWETEQAMQTATEQATE